VNDAVASGTTKVSSSEPAGGVATGPRSTLQSARRTLHVLGVMVLDRSIAVGSQRYPRAQRSLHRATQTWSSHKPERQSPSRAHDAPGVAVVAEVVSQIRTTLFDDVCAQSR